MPTPEEAIHAGRSAYAAKKFKLALENFTRAMKLCSCTRGMKRERCSCKNFEAVAGKNGSIFHEAMYTCKCPVGKTFNKCDNILHIQALDYRAATFEALQELDRAKKDAEWILELAPRLPDGYLRLGKILRLQKKHEFAWKICNAGIEATASNSGNPQKLQQLYKLREPLQLRFRKIDPFNLPTEVIQLICSYVDLWSLVRCIQVCKNWKETLTASGNRRLWRSLRFESALARRIPRLDGIKALLAYSGHDIRELHIKDAKAFSLTQLKFSVIMKSAKNLETLEMANVCDPLELPIPLKSLKLLSLHVRGKFANSMSTGNSPYFKFMSRVTESLVNLTTYGYPLEWVYRKDCIPKMPNLKYFRILKDEDIDVPLSIFELFRVAPNLEQICVSGGLLTDELPAGQSWDGEYPNLQVLQTTHEPAYVSSDIRACRFLASMNRGLSLKYLDIKYDWKHEQNETSEILNGMHNGEPYEYENLQAFRLRDMSLAPQRAQQLFETAVKRGVLHSFDIVFPYEPLNGQVGKASTEHLAGYGWLEGAEGIRYMALLGFSFPTMYTDEKKMPLIKFISSFPNLEVLELLSLNYEEKDMFVLVRDVLKSVQLKTLYFTQVRGVMMDELKKLGASKGVELIWGARPREWPVILDQT